MAAEIDSYTDFKSRRFADWIKNGGNPVVFNISNRNLRNQMEEIIIEFGGYAKRNKIIVSDHDLFVIGWLNSDKRRDIFDYAIFNADTDINRVIITHSSNITANEVGFLESKGLQFADYLPKYRELKKLLALNGVGT